MKRIILLAACLFMALCMMTPFQACAQHSEQKVVRVGWYEST